MKNDNKKQRHLVAVVTRTKDRNILLKRVVRTLKDQTFKDFIWVIVNDAGEEGPVDKVARKAIAYGMDVCVVHRTKSLGMEAASNNGVNESKSKYIAIHDDDDTWEPTFLEKTVDFLELREEFVGVITHSDRINEELTTDSVNFVSKVPYNHWLCSVQIADMSITNHFPPISFLFRRELFDNLGGFDESLPVLGDYDFHLRSLMLGDVGVIPEPLANYHFRMKIKIDDLSHYGNSVTSSVDKHIEFDAKYRNRKFREDIENNQIGLGHVLYFGRLQKHIADKVDRTDQRITKIIKVFKKVPFVSKLLKRK